MSFVENSLWKCYFFIVVTIVKRFSVFFFRKRKYIPNLSPSSTNNYFLLGGSPNMQRELSLEHHRGKGSTEGGLGSTPGSAVGHRASPLSEPQFPPVRMRITLLASQGSRRIGEMILVKSLALGLAHSSCSTKGTAAASQKASRHPGLSGIPSPGSNCPLWNTPWAPVLVNPLSSTCHSLPL